MTDPPPITQRDGAVLIAGDALPLMHRACLALVARRHRDGLAASPLLNQARTTLYRATMGSSYTKMRRRQHPRHAAVAMRAT